jgi:bifunctional UDP-N-acetylglucosamine pyrophosphorylase/glucosamine-1-phosphate N-acetyltransferase
MSAPVAVILAAGKSTRMKSEVPKVLHPVCGRLMIEYVLDAARGAGAERLVVVVGHKADLVRSSLAHHHDVVFAEQTEQKGPATQS